MNKGVCDSRCQCHSDIYLKKWRVRMMRACHPIIPCRLMQLHIALCSGCLCECGCLYFACYVPFFWERPTSLWLCWCHAIIQIYSQRAMFVCVFLGHLINIY